MQVFFPQEAQKLNKIHFKELSKFSLIAKERPKKIEDIDFNTIVFI